MNAPAYLTEDYRLEMARLRAERDVLLREVKDFIMAHDRGYFGHALKIEGKDNSFVSGLRDALAQVRP
jgi:hypothetical protein